MQRRGSRSRCATLSSAIAAHGGADQSSSNRLGAKEERLSTLAEIESEQLSIVDESGFKKGQPGEFVRRVEYTDKEAVVLLLEAARRLNVNSTNSMSVEKLLSHQVKHG